ncbi:MAG: hypothetical protein QXN68_06340 [Thermoplasmata archaeon]
MIDVFIPILTNINKKNTRDIMTEAKMRREAQKEVLLQELPFLKRQCITIVDYLVSKGYQL